MLIVVDKYEKSDSQHNHQQKYEKYIQESHSGEMAIHVHDQAKLELHVIVNMNKTTKAVVGPKTNCTGSLFESIMSRGSQMGADVDM